MTPDTAGPRPKPAVNVSDARLAATDPATGGYGGADSSLIQLLPTTMAAATLSPQIRRPTASAGTEAAPSPSTTLPRMPSTTPIASSGLRPKRSESGPAIRKPGMMPTM